LLTKEVSRYLRLRRLILVPYVYDLISKEEDGHDCRDCGGGCSVHHSVQIDHIRTAHRNIGKLISQVRANDLPFTPGMERHEAYRMLRLAMVLLNNTLTEILFIEESALIPMLTELQQKIGAHG
jgi:hypothetical protein